MKQLSKILTLLIFLISTSDIYAQEFFRLKESIGMPLRFRTYVDLKGSPYFIDSWTKGIIKQSNGQISKNIELKYDQLEDELIFKNANGRSLVLLFQ
ncbi:hypothetical protein DU508_05585 [Pedobacter chinensis]|uniref:Uncharacterized protein n=1 Tax=Pedobacter chinensis TaxID=2282421 RepID=A0A369PVI7_9SPHI|nr:hypothetical protein [Pedobacter chinensis]RDC56681.1 hypothetical protein DU508_05585 [Pedobacter chinensis]